MFIKEFIRHSKQIGAIVPSSKYLAAKMIHSVNFETANIVIELGAGTGIFTYKILEKLHANAILLVFETNDSFFGSLKNNITDKRVILIHDSAEKIPEYLMKLGFSKADYIISSLPLANIPGLVKTKIIRNIHEALTTTGIYIQFQYSLLMLNQLKVQFKKVNVGFESLNFPPAFVFSCSK
jgi:phosphatidylethanolamine/phosphatidyl-N-methylethanolamine N-methyltransferase